MSNRFPKDHQAFVGDKSLQREIKSLEDRIEQRYQAHQLMQSLLEIANLIETKSAPKRTSPIPPDLLAAFNDINKEAPSPTQFDKDRDAIWEMVRRSGKQYVLAFLSPKLWLSLEVLFSGIVVSYIQMFAGSDGRSKLEHSNVFKNNSDLKVAHEKLNMLRNKQYAHKEFEDDRHQLSYFVDNQDVITIDVNGVQHAKHYHHELCKDFLRCLGAVISYLEQDIRKREVRLIEKLSKDQKLVLLQLPTSDQ
jgi:adenine-specific DNA glycosylase